MYITPEQIDFNPYYWYEKYFHFTYFKFYASNVLFYELVYKCVLKSVQIMFGYYYFTIFLPFC